MSFVNEEIRALMEGSAIEQQRDKGKITLKELDESPDGGHDDMDSPIPAETRMLEGKYKKQQRPSRRST